MPGYERFLVQIFITLIPVIGLYFSMKDKATKQENRLTILEKDIENLNEFKTSANKRLDNHDEQNLSLIHISEPTRPY